MTPEFHAICDDLGLIGRKGCRIRPVIGLILCVEKHVEWPKCAADLGCRNLSDKQFERAAQIIRDYRAGKGGVA